MEHKPARVAKRRLSRGTRWALGILAGLLVVLLGLGTVLTIALTNALNSATSGRGGSPVGVFVPQPLEGEGTGRVNVLIAANSFDDPEHPGALLTDSIMVATVDVATKRSALISVPRDLWVDYEGRQTKINAVFVYAGGGTAGLKALGGIVERVTGLHIDQHVLIGYNAVRDTVNAVGGLEVTIATSDPRGIYDPLVGLTLPAGTQTLDGDTVIKLARCRNLPVPGRTPYGLPRGDFDRQQNQRMLVAALATKLKTTPALANPVAVVTIFNSVGKNVLTDLDAGQIRRFYDLMSGGQIASVSIRGEGEPSLLRNYTAPGGGAAMVPTAGMFDYSQIHAMVQKVTA